MTHALITFALIGAGQAWAFMVGPKRLNDQMGEAE